MKNQKKKTQASFCDKRETLKHWYMAYKLSSFFPELIHRRTETTTVRELEGKKRKVKVIATIDS